MLRTLRALWNHPLFDTFLYTAVAGIAVHGLQNLIEKRQDIIRELDNQIQSKVAKAYLLDSQTAAAASPGVDAMRVEYPSREDVDPLGHGDDVDQTAAVG